MFKQLVRVAVCLVLITGATAPADAQSDVKRQQVLAEAALKQAGIKNAVPVETDGILMYGTVPDAQAKALAGTLQKVYQSSRSALSYGQDDALWPGKMTVVVLSDPQQFAAYFQRVNGKPPAEGQTSALSLQGDSPYLIIGPSAGTSPRDFDPTRTAATLMAAAVLNQRAGTGPGKGTLPDWLIGGFTEGMLMRADSDPDAMARYRNSMRTAVLGNPNGNPQMAVMTDSWTGPRSAANNIRSAAFLEYLRERNSPATFNRFLAAFRQVEGQPTPTLDSALKTLPLSKISMETDFKVWAAQQK